MFYNDPRSYAWYGKRAVLYIRVSTDEQARHGYSLEAQLAELQAFCSQFGMTIAGIYKDEGISARKELTRRPALRQVLEAVQAGGVDYVLFIKLDRWFRSVREYYKVQDILEACGVNWKATMEDYDTSTTNGRLNLNIRLSIAQDESDRTGDRIKFVFNERIKHGGAIVGSQCLPYALEVKEHHVAVVEDQAAAVRGLFDYFEASGSVRSCVPYLKQAYGLNLAYNTIKRMLRNPLYCGQYRDNPDYCQGIITREQWQHVQNVLDYRANTGTRQRVYDYVFAGLIRCPECGTTLKSAPSYDYKHGRKFYPRYRCNQCWIEHRCTFKGAPWEKRIEDWLLDHIQPELRAYAARFEIAEQRRAVSKIDTRRIEKKIDQLQELWLEELILKDRYRVKYAALQAELAEAQAQNNAQPAPRDLGAVRQLLAGDFRAIYEELTPAERHALWVSVVDHIDVAKASRGQWEFSVTFLP